MISHMTNNLWNFACRQKCPSDLVWLHSYLHQSICIRVDWITNLLFFHPNPLILKDKN